MLKIDDENFEAKQSLSEYILFSAKALQLCVSRLFV